MAGVADFQVLSVTLPKRNEALLQLTFPDLASEASYQVTVYSPAGTMSTIVTAACKVNQSGATAGQLQAFWEYPNALGSVTSATFTYAGTWPLWFNNGGWTDGSGSQTGTGLSPQPQAPANQAYWIAGTAQIDDSVGFTLTIVNALNVTVQGSDMSADIKVVVEDLP